MSTGAVTKAIVVASLPPPTVGQAMVTQRIVNELQRVSTVPTYDWLPPSKYGPLQKVHKAALSLGALSWVLMQRLRGYRRLYNVANAGVGLYYNLLLLICARCLGFQFLLHHHGTSYLHPRNRCLKWIDALMRPGDEHVVLGDEMLVMLQDDCQSRWPVRVVMNGFMIEPQDRQQLHGERKSRAAAPTNLVLGHLSNLCHAKGLDIVFATFRGLWEQVPDAKLLLAGPAFTKEAESMIASAQREFGERLEYLGGIYGEDKNRFFDRVSVFVYPTRDDAQPLVVLEAMSFAVPVLATPIGCIPSLVRSPECLSQSVNEFSAFACRRIGDWWQRPDQLADAGQQALAEASSAREQSLEQLHALVGKLLGHA